MFPLNNMEEQTQRPDWDRYFMDICNLVSKRSTCLRRQVGAIIVKEKRVLTTGYNGAPKGLPHCLDLGCLRTDFSIPSGTRLEVCRGAHGEENAIVQAARFGIQLDGGELYCTHQPCMSCTKMTINAGIKRVVFAGDYPSPMSLEFLLAAGLQVEKYDVEKGFTTEIEDEGDRLFLTSRAYELVQENPELKKWADEIAGMKSSSGDS